MRIGISNYSFAAYVGQTGCDIYRICDLAKEIGYEVIDFISGAFKGAEDPIAAAAQLRAYCDSIGLSVGAYTVNASMWEQGCVEKLCREIDVAEALGVSLMRHDVCYKLPEGKDWRQTIDMMKGNIRAATEYAMARGIMTCTENHGYIFQDPERMVALFEAVGHPNYRWLVDIGNFLCADCDPIASVRMALPYVVHVHVKDFLYFKRDERELMPEGEHLFSTTGGNLLRGTILGQGDVPVVACIRMLREAGYDGVFTLEFEGEEENLGAVKAGCAYLKKIAALPVEA